MRLAHRFVLSMMGSVLLTTSVVMFLDHRQVVSTVRPAELQRLQSRAQRSLARLDDHVSDAGRAVRASRQSLALEGLVRARRAGGIDPSTGLRESVCREALARRLRAELEGHPEYHAYRLIGVADDGREVLRVDREGPGGRVRVVPSDSLQTKGDLPFFREALRRQPDELYVSACELQSDHGRPRVPAVPVLRVATPVCAEDGSRFGVLVINLDLRELHAALLRIDRARRATSHLYLIDDDGAFVMHPDESCELAGPRADSVRLHDQFPAIARRLGDLLATPGVVRERGVEPIGVGATRAQVAGGPRLTLIETVPESVLMSSASGVPGASLPGALLLAAATALFALSLSRSVTRPLAQLTRAVGDLEPLGPSNLPTAGGELRGLADAIARMQSTALTRAGELRATGARLTQVIDGLPHLAWTCDAEGVCDFVNHRWLEYAGGTAADHVGIDWRTRVHPDDREAAGLATERAAGGAGAREVGLRLRGADGGYRRFTTRLAPLETRQDRVTRWVGTLTAADDR
jgi:PAS domain S-box-containing protein